MSLLEQLYPNGYNLLMPATMKSLRWVASSKKDLMAMPEDVQDTFGYALHLAQAGQKHPDAKAVYVGHCYSEARHGFD